MPNSNKLLSVLERQCRLVVQASSLPPAPKSAKGFLSKTPAPQLPLLRSFAERGAAADAGQLMSKVLKRNFKLS